MAEFLVFRLADGSEWKKQIVQESLDEALTGFAEREGIYSRNLLLVDEPERAWVRYDAIVLVRREPEG